MKKCILVLILLLINSFDLTSDIIEDSTLFNINYIITTRNDLLSSINSIYDIEESFWINECYHNKNDIDEYNFNSYYGYGYIFLKNYYILLVDTICDSFYDEINDKFYCGNYYIYNINELTTYVIIDEAIILNHGKQFFEIKIHFNDGILILDYPWQEINEIFVFRDRFITNQR